MTSLPRALLPGLAALCLCTTSAQASRFHVDASAPPGGDGTTWGTAFTELHSALAVAQAGDEVWVAAGTYRPAAATAPFVLQSGVSILGGFAGSEVSATERNWVTNVVILSGDMLGDDGPGFANYGDNARPICASQGANATAVLDGFVLQGAGDTAIQNYASSPTIRHCKFRHNLGGADGGGIQNEGSSPLVADCGFEDNYAGANGAGIYNRGGSSPTILRCRFVHCAAGEAGGAITSTAGSSPVIRDSNFRQNTTARGGAVNNQDGSNSLIAQCVFEDNVATVDGGAILSPLAGSLVLVNCLFRGNSAPLGSVLSYDSAATPRVVNCISVGNSGGEFEGDGSAQISSCCLQQPHPGAGNFAADPMLVLGSNGLWSPAPGSPCIDRGDNSALPAAVTQDLAGGARFVDDPSSPDHGFGTSPIVDLGPVEFAPPSCFVETYCIAAPNSTGQGALLHVVGTSSVAANDLSLVVTGGAPGMVGMFFYGHRGAAVPFGNGYLCVRVAGPGPFRLPPPAHANGTGIFRRDVDLTAAPAGSGPGRIEGGSTWAFQLWYRNPLGGGPGFNLSNAAEVHFCP